MRQGVGGSGGLAAHVVCQSQMYPQELGVYMPYFTPYRAHLLLRGVYGYFPHNNNKLHLGG